MSPMKPLTEGFRHNHQLTVNGVFLLFILALSACAPQATPGHLPPTITPVSSPSATPELTTDPNCPQIEVQFLTPRNGDITEFRGTTHQWWVVITKNGAKFLSSGLHKINREDIVTAYRCNSYENARFLWSQQQK